MNNREREMWVLNDEYLYRWWKQGGGSLKHFIKTNRLSISVYIHGQLSRKPAA